MGRAEPVYPFVTAALTTWLLWQALRALLAGIYYQNLVVLSLNATLLYALFLLAPAAYLVGLPASSRLLLPTAVLLLAFRWTMHAAWGTPAHPLLAGLAVATALLLFPLLLPAARRASGAGGGYVALGVVLGIVADGVVRLLAASGDVSAGPQGWRLTLPLGALLLYAVFRLAREAPGSGPKETLPRGKTLAAGGALGAWLFLEFAFLASPQVVARWSGQPLGVGIASLGGLLVGPFLLRLPVVRRRAFPVLGGLHAVLLVALAHFALGPSLALPLLLALAQIGLVAALTVLLSFLAEGDSRAAAGAFVAGTVTLLLLLFGLAFTLAYGYVPLGRIWEGKEGALILAAGVVVGSAALLTRGFRSFPRLPTTPRALSLLFAALLLVPLVPVTLPPPPPGTAVRVLTYNVHQGFNNDGQVDPDLLLRVIQAADADLVALQESDTARFTSANLDLVGYLASRLGYHAFYGPPTRAQSFGVALLSRHPLVEAFSTPLPATDDERFLLSARVDVHGRSVWVLVTHLALGLEDREAETRAILTLAGGLAGPTVLAGDFNSCPSGRCPRDDGPADGIYAEITATYRDAWTAAGRGRDDPAGHTYSAQDPFQRIDYVFVSPDLAVLAAERIRTPEAVRASDHLPVLARLDLSG